jgi:hypothetical protein
MYDFTKGCVSFFFII